MNTYALTNGGSWTPIVASEGEPSVCGECQGITEIEYVRLALDRHSLEMGQFVAADVLRVS